MKKFVWDDEKNKWLSENREVCFDEIVYYISQGYMIDILEHHNKLNYPGQKIFVVEILNYIYLIPFVENDEMIFLQTIISSRKATKKYKK